MAGVKTALAFLLLAISPLCLAQKWVDESGKVYYGTPPAGVNVKPARMTGGASSTVGSQPPNPDFPAPTYVPTESWQEQMRNQEYERRRVEKAMREAEQRQRDDEEREAGWQTRQEEEQRRMYGH